MNMNTCKKDVPDGARTAPGIYELTDATTDTRVAFGVNAQQICMGDYGVTVNSMRSMAEPWLLRAENSSM